MPKQLSLLLLAVFAAVPSFAQNFKQEFDLLLSARDAERQVQLLAEWQKIKPNDAELFIAWFNYYFFKSRQEGVLLTTAADPQPALAVKDSTGEHTVGYLADDIHYDLHLLQQGLQYIDTGINKYPERLDMRFGKIYALGQVENFEAFTKEIIRAIDYSSQIKNQWTWSDNKKIDAPNQFLLNAIQDYVVQLYNAGDDQLNRMQQIAQAVLKYYPDHIPSLSNLAITYGLQGKYDNALKTLLKAEKIAPTDYIVLNNIANMYERKGDKHNAIRYYELTKKYGDQQAKITAVEKLQKLAK